jgi:hypothetical protein
MKVKTLEYSKLKNLGDYENEKIGVVVELEDGESPVDALKRAKNFIHNAQKKSINQSTYDLARERVSSPDNYTGAEIKKYQAIIDNYENDTFEF